MTGMDASGLALLGVFWLAFTFAVTASTWTISKTRVDSPIAVTVCNLLLSPFPPLNLLVLTFLCAMDRKVPA